GQKPSQSITQELYRVTAFVLRAYDHPANWTNEVPKEILPREFTYAIERQAYCIGQGQLPDPIRDCIAPHRPRVGPQERDDICWAVLYIRAVRENLIQDRSPIKTIARRFGVHARTAKRWNAEYDAISLVDGLRYIDQSEAPAHIAKGMREAAERYCI